MMYNIFSDIYSKKLSVDFRIFYDPCSFNYKDLCCDDAYKLNPACLFPMEIPGRKIISPDGFIKYSVPESFYNDILTLLE